VTRSAITGLFLALVQYYVQAPVFGEKKGRTWRHRKKEMKKKLIKNVPEKGWGGSMGGDEKRGVRRGGRNRRTLSPVFWKKKGKSAFLWDTKRDRFRGKWSYLPPEADRQAKTYRDARSLKNSVEEI